MALMQNYAKSKLPVMKAMKIGDKATYPIEEVNSVRASITNLSYTDKLYFKTERSGCDIIVTRISEDEKLKSARK